MLTIRLPADIENRLNALSKSTGRTKTFYAREAILAHMDELEAVYLAEHLLMDARASQTESMRVRVLMKRKP
ncbi:TraY domain-containing protein [Chitinimonas sp. BJB300]|uniref:type II toxin-antitoxin system RelB family antitoxin n=1 Tax=Chitinimonas sp. BJB300 TaxID=1559339 RepID=UPI000C1199EF|nr:TraY domain-containing protein [Chitinimonas sp. BJB300]PHV09961.1 CopG family transcriptional regulator [Chitinimonas sp. BJB300]PHV10107.1 CopG family transcriptional regulator [Chitinimonas sp. BJB300]TSJ83737.1 TraY domain-containing protein [Chitinimonas sp. BJB300]TSJ83744.1 TraY domain-containing protein [Chitinimonas sp. BJB300]TSJ84629.1 TraY domain-containing protein [Chitinimonas sp. BJB300]